MYDFDNIGEAIEAAVQKVTNDLQTRVLVVATTALKGEYIERIFTEGKDSNDSKIGSYSTAPGYYSQEQFVKKGSFKPQGKTGEKKFKEGPRKGQAHKSMYLQNGYKQFREVQGLNAGTVVAELTGSLKNNIQVVTVSENEVGLGLTSDREIKKRKALEAKYNKKIFAASPRDISYLENVIIEEIQSVKGEI